MNADKATKVRDEFINNNNLITIGENTNLNDILIEIHNKACIGLDCVRHIQNSYYDGETTYIGYNNHISKIHSDLDKLGFYISLDVDNDDRKETYTIYWGDVVESL